MNEDLKQMKADVDQIGQALREAIVGIASEIHDAEERGRVKRNGLAILGERQRSELEARLSAKVLQAMANAADLVKDHRNDAAAHIDAVSDYATNQRKNLEDTFTAEIAALAERLDELDQAR